jgi:hypothetical protein
VGGDAEPTMVAMAEANLAHFEPAIRALPPPPPPPPRVLLGDAAAEQLQGADVLVCNLPFGRTVSFGASRVRHQALASGRAVQADREW